MSMRCTEDGWELVAMHDPSGRRGLWCRIGIPGSPTIPSSGAVELCAGREGDDAYVKIEPGVKLTDRDVDCLREVLAHALYAKELSADTQGDDNSDPESS